MKLYYSPGACSLAAHIVEIEGGLNLALEKVDIQAHKTADGADFFAVNPKGYVPAVLLDDGTLLTENTAILPFLGDKAGLMPSEGIARYRALEWIGYIATELHKAFTPLFHGGSETEKAEAKEEILKRLQFIEERISGNWLMGERFMAPDAYLYVILRWAQKMHIDLSGLPRLLAYRARVEARPSVQQAMAAERQR
jgi:glutathione S-transferase